MSYLNRVIRRNPCRTTSGTRRAGSFLLISGVVAAGTARHWTERQAVSMVIGNPGGISLTVNGKNPVPPGSANQVVTLSFGPGQKAVS